VSVVSDRKGTEGRVSEQDCTALAVLGRTLIPAMRSYRTCSSSSSSSSISSSISSSSNNNNNNNNNNVLM
jgi:hypothetical protein